VWLGIALGLLAWIPLVALTAFDNTLTGGSTHFLASFATHTRLLLSIPLFFVAEAAFHQRVREAFHTIVASRLVPARELPRLAETLLRARRWLDSWLFEAAVLGFTAAILLVGLRYDPPAGLSTWRSTSAGEPTLAGLWYSLVAIPMVQFLTWRWFARLLIWCHVLWQMTRLDLRLVPIHPDRSGGLGGLGVAHVALAPLAFALSATITSTVAEEALYGGVDMRKQVLPVAIIIVTNVFVLLAPLLICVPRLMGTKQHALFEYGLLAAEYTRAFDDKWIKREVGPDEPLLGSADIQSLNDLAGSFNLVTDMRLVPISRVQILYLLAAAVLPAVPLIFVVLPLDEFIIYGARTVLGI
jgi:hypothetical protein